MLNSRCHCVWHGSSPYQIVCLFVRDSKLKCPLGDVIPIWKMIHFIRWNGLKMVPNFNVTLSAISAGHGISNERHQCQCWFTKMNETLVVVFCEWNKTWDSFANICTTQILPASKLFSEFFDSWSSWFHNWRCSLTFDALTFQTTSINPSYSIVVVGGISKNINETDDDDASCIVSMFFELTSIQGPQPTGQQST